MFHQSSSTTGGHFTSINLFTQDAGRFILHSTIERNTSTGEKKGERDSCGFDAVSFGRGIGGSSRNSDALMVWLCQRAIVVSYFTIVLKSGLDFLVDQYTCSIVKDTLSTCICML